MQLTPEEIKKKIAEQPLTIEPARFKIDADQLIDNFCSTVTRLRTEKQQHLTKMDFMYFGILVDIVYGTRQFEYSQKRNKEFLKSMNKETNQ